MAAQHGISSGSTPFAKTKTIFRERNCDYFPIQQFKHLFSSTQKDRLGRFFEYPQLVSIEKKR